MLRYHELMMLRYHNLQRQLETLTELADKCKSAAALITVSEVVTAMSCTSPPSFATAERFCHFALRLATYGDQTSFSVIQRSNILPVIIDMLRYWSANTEIVWRICRFIVTLLKRGPSTLNFKAALQRIPGCAAALTTAAASHLDENNEAAVALVSLGFSSIEQLEDSSDVGTEMDPVRLFLEDVGCSYGSVAILAALQFNHDYYVLNMIVYDGITTLSMM